MNSTDVFINKDLYNQWHISIIVQMKAAVALPAGKDLWHVYSGHLEKGIRLFL